MKNQKKRGKKDKCKIEGEAEKKRGENKLREN